MGRISRAFFSLIGVAVLWLAGVYDIHSHPVVPRTARVSLIVSF